MDLQRRVAEDPPRPDDRAVRYRVMEWRNYILDEIHKPLMLLLQGDVDTSTTTALVTVLRENLMWLDWQLEGKNFLSGESCTAADAELATLLERIGQVQVDLNDLKHIGAFMTRAAAHGVGR